MAEIAEAPRQPVSFQVPIKDIAVLDRARKIYNNVEALAVSLDTYGQIQPIRVRRPTEEESEEAKGRPWVLVTGGRRLMAATMNKWQTIRGEDYDSMEPWMRLAIELEENLQRENMHFSEVAANKEKLHNLYKEKFPDWTLEKTAELIGESIVNVSRDIALSKEIRENPELKKATNKKAALASVKLTQHIKARESQLATNIQSQQLRKKLVCADARDWIRTVPTASVNLVAGDLPYGIDYFELPTPTNAEGGGMSQYDDSKQKAMDLIADLVPELVRVTKPNGWIVICMNWELHTFLEEHLNNVCTKHFGYRVEDDSRRCSNTAEGARKYSCEYSRCEDIPWLWYRPNSRNNPRDHTKHAQNQYELITVYNRGDAVLVQESRVGNVLEFDSEYDERIHAMQKPIAMWEEIIQRCTLYREVVLDPTFGSGTSMAASAKLGRDFLGCEQNKGLIEPALGLVSQYWLGEQSSEDKFAPDPEGLQPVPFD